MSSDKHQYAILQTKLEKRALELKHRLQSIKHDLTQSHTSDWSDQAQERENDEVLNQLGHGVEGEIHAIDAALKRLEENHYGHCLGCGNPIAMARLTIKPEATLCADCAHTTSSQ